MCFPKPEVSLKHSLVSVVSMVSSHPQDVRQRVETHLIDSGLNICEEIHSNDHDH